MVVNSINDIIKSSDSLKSEIEKYLKENDKESINQREKEYKEYFTLTEKNILLKQIMHNKLNKLKKDFTLNEKGKALKSKTDNIEVEILKCYLYQNKK